MYATGKRGISMKLHSNLRIIYIGTLLISILTAIASITGLLEHETVYPDPELLRAFLPNDLIMLLIGLPILLGSMFLTWRGKLSGLLF